MAISEKNNYVIYSAFNRPSIKGQEFKDTEPVYGLIADHNGSESVGITGETNTYKKIQDANVGLDIAQLVEKYTDGELSDNDPNNFIDVSEIPKDPLAAHMYLVNLKRKFEKTELDFRKRYDFDFGKFLKSAEKEKYVKEFVESKTPKKEKVEVKDVEVSEEK